MFVIPDLVESFEYFIRVKAVLDNMAGISEPGLMRETVVVVAALSAPEIIFAGNMNQERIVKAGTNCYYSSYYSRCSKLELSTPTLILANADNC